MRNGFTLLFILIGFVGLFASQSMSFSSVALPVNMNSSVTSGSQAIISAGGVLEVDLTDKKGQPITFELTNHLNQPVTLIKDDIYPAAGARFFHIKIPKRTLQPYQSLNVKAAVFGKPKTPSGQYEMPLQFRWENGKASIPMKIQLTNDLRHGKKPCTRPDRNCGKKYK